MLSSDPMDGPAWGLTGITGTMAAALAQDALVFAFGAVANPVGGPSQVLVRAPLQIEGIQIVYTAIVAAATPVTAGRRLAIYKGTNGTMPTGGTSLTPVAKRTKDQTADNGLLGGTALIATTAGLTAGGFTRSANPIATIDLVGLGHAGDRNLWQYYKKWDASSLWLDPGEILVISNPQAFDATLTWQLSIDVDYRSRDGL